MNHLYEPLVAQDDVKNIRISAKSLIIEFDPAKLQEQHAHALKCNSRGGCMLLRTQLYKECELFRMQPC